MARKRRAEWSRKALHALIAAVGLGFVTVVLLSFLIPDTRPASIRGPGNRAESEGGTAGGIPSANRASKVQIESKKGSSPEDSEQLEGEETEEPVLAGTVYGPSGPVAGAKISAWSFKLVRDLIEKYEALNITGVPDIAALIRSLRRDLSELRQKAAATRSGPDGGYAFYRLEPGEYFFLVTASGYVFRAGDSTCITPGITRRLDFRLNEGRVIAGRVVDKNGRPVQGASVLAVYHVGGGEVGRIVRRLLGLLNGEFLKGPFEDKTGPEGRFRLDSLPAGTYELSVEHPDFAPLEVPSVQTGTTDIVLQLGEGGSVTAHLVTVEGKPVAGAPCRLTALDRITAFPLPVPGADRLIDTVRRLIGEEDLRELSSPEGTVEFVRVTPGRYRFVCEARGFLECRRDLVVEEGKTADLGILVLDPGSVIRGQVVFKDGRPVPNATVTVHEEAGRNFRLLFATLSAQISGKRRSRTDEKGFFTVSGLAGNGGTYRVLAFKEKLGMGMTGGVVPDGDPVKIVLEEPWFVKGKIIREATGEPVAGARITGGGAACQSDREGRFELGPALPDGSRVLFRGGTPRLRLFVSAPGLSPAERFLERGDLGREVLIELQEEAALEGIVRRPDGDPQPGALVRLVPPELPPVGGLELLTLGVTFCGPDGRFRFGSLRPGLRVRVVAMFPGYAPARSEAFLLEGGKAPFCDLLLAEGGKLLGLVTDGLTPLGGIKVRLAPASRKREIGRAAFFLKLFGLPEAGRVTYTDSEGRFEYADLVPGTYTVTATAGTGIARSVEVEILGGEQSEVRIELDIGGDISGVVVDAEGVPVAFATVRLLSAENASLLGLQRAFGGALATQTTGENGAFLFSQVRRGKYVLAAEKQGYAPAELPGVEIDGGPYRLVLKPEASLGVLVREAFTGDPVTQFEVRLEKVTKSGAWQSPLKAWRAVDSAEGFYRYEGLAEGRYRVEVRAQGCAPGAAEATLDPGTEHVVEIQLERPGAVQGVVLLGEEGTPVQGARVAVIASRFSSSHGSAGEAFGKFMEERMKEIAGRSDSDGTFLLADVPAGTHTIEATHPKLRPGRTEVVVRSGETVYCEIRLREGFRLSGRLLNHKGEPEPGRVLLLEGPGGFSKATASREDGAWTFEGLRKGTFRLWCPTPDLSRDAPPLILKIEGDTSGVELTLPPPPDEAPEAEESGEEPQRVPAGASPPAGLPPPPGDK